MEMGEVDRTTKNSSYDCLFKGSYKIRNNIHAFRKYPKIYEKNSNCLFHVSE
jgi:hypothetical protein